MERQTVVIISDEPEFSTAATRRWLNERNVPAFILAESSSSARIGSEAFDLAVVGGLASERIGHVLEALRGRGKPVIHVSRMNGRSPQVPNTISLPEVEEWPELLVVVAAEILARSRATRELSKITEESSQLGQHAALGRYILEMRHSLNNALTSILGNSDLILLNADELPASLRAQIETIRNMGMRINEIMQRFSSLQKEMQLVNQQSWTKAAGKGAGAGD